MGDAIEMRTGRFAAICLSSVFLIPAFARPSLASDEWRHLTTKDGIEVSEREVPGRAFPIFRGVGIIEAKLYDVFAVISDVERYTEWMYRCVDARQVRRESETVRYTYNRTGAPWPVRDRDVVLRSKVIVVEPGRKLHVRFESVEDDSVGPVKGVVRMRRLEGHYKLEALAPEQTRVEYQADADPAGRLPAWLVKRNTRDLPLQTLLKLRQQVTKTRGQYGEFIGRWDPTRR
jgi:ribosome-associated toxin RatA of RatAB toxin-antitoxin module